MSFNFSSIYHLLAVNTLECELKVNEKEIAGRKQLTLIVMFIGIDKAKKKQ